MNYAHPESEVHKFIKVSLPTIRAGALEVCLSQMGSGRDEATV